MTASPTGMEMGLPVVDDFEAALEAFGGGHGDGADPVIAEVLLDFEGEFGGVTLDGVIQRKGVIDRRQLVRELDIDDGADDLNDFAFIHAIKTGRV